MTDSQHLPGNPFEANAQDDPRNTGGTTANALLAVAYELRINGEAARLQQQAAHNTQAFLDNIERGIIPAKPVEYRWTDTDGFIRNRDGLPLCGQFADDGARCIREPGHLDQDGHIYRDRVIKP